MNAIEQWFNKLKRRMKFQSNGYAYRQVNDFQNKKSLNIRF